jgi:thymidine kinase
MYRHGGLFFFVGPTGSGKTEQLEKELARYWFTHDKKVLAIKSKIDTRETNGNAFSTHRSDLSEVKRLSEIPWICVDSLEEVDIKDNHVYGIDEAQFFPDIERVLEWVMVHKKIVICTALNLDFRGLPFNCKRIEGDPHIYAGGVAIVREHADKTKYLFGTCAKCLEEHRKNGTLETFNTKNAMYSARLTESKELIEIGNKYAPMCRTHFMEHYKFEFYRG